MNITNGMLLSAGLGTRLLPITEKIPKPIVPMLNIPGIVYNIHMFKSAGISNIVINLHHLGDCIEECLGDGSSLGIRIQYTKEKKLLGTAGGVKFAEPHLSGEYFVLSNSDFVSDLELKPVIEFHLKNEALATMVLIENEELQPYYSKVGTSSEGHLCHLPSLTTTEPVRQGIFTGVHILHRSIFDHIKAEFSGINQVLYPKLMKDSPKRVFGYYAEKTSWHDTGDLSGFWMTAMELLAGIDSSSLVTESLAQFGYQPIEPGIWTYQGEKLPNGVIAKGPIVLGRNISVGASTRVGPFAVIGDGCTIAERTIIENAVLLPRADVSEFDRIRQVIAFQESLLPVIPKNIRRGTA